MARTPPVKRRPVLQHFQSPAQYCGVPFTSEQAFLTCILLLLAIGWKWSTLKFTGWMRPQTEAQASPINWRLSWGGKLHNSNDAAQYEVVRHGASIQREHRKGENNIKKLLVIIAYVFIAQNVTQVALADDDFHGIVESRPAGTAGIWVVGGAPSQLPRTQNSTMTTNRRSQ